MMRRTQTLATEDVDAWLKKLKIGTETKYGIGGHQKRATGMNLCVGYTLENILCID